MSNDFQITEGVILRAIPFRDHDHILSLFTRDVGLMKILYRGSRTSKGSKKCVCTPLSKVEVIYQEKRGEIFSCREMHSLDLFPDLRKNLHFLEVGCDLLHVISAAQMPGKASPSLYDLLLFYLKKIPFAAYPWVLSASFRMKMLLHEGVTSFPLACMECGLCLVEEAFFCGNEIRCVQHRQMGSTILTAAELRLLAELALCKNFQEIASIQLSAVQYIRIKCLYESVKT